MTRIAVLSDIHGNLPALKACVADARGQRCTASINLGDILSGPLWPLETADYLMGQGWPTIAGNHDRQIAEDEDHESDKVDAFARDRLTEAHRAWIATLPVDMTLPGGVRCHHARPGNDCEYLLETKLDIGAVKASDDQIASRLKGENYPLFLHGHSHLQRDVTLPDGRRIVNPGSVGLPAYFKGDPWPDLAEAGPRACYAILEGSAVEHRRVAYDWQAVAEKAENEGFVGWADHLRNGLAR